jgi:ribose transport system substrate-binding protein
MSIQKKLAVPSMLVVLGLLASACAGGATGGEPTEVAITSEVQGARAVAESYMQPVAEYQGPKVGPAATTGKRVVGIPCGASSEGCVRPILGAQEAGEVLGWDVELCDPDFDIAQYQACIDMAINTDSDAVILMGVNPEFVKDELNRAHEAGLVVASIEDVDPDPALVDFNIDAGYDEQGKALANFLFWQTDGKPFTSLQWERSYNSVVQLNETFVEEYERLGGQWEDLDFTEGEIGEAIGSRTVSAIQANPAINSVVNFDDSNLFIIPELRTAGLLQDVIVAGYTAIGPGLDLIRSGDMAASASGPQNWMGWAALDNLNRIFSGEDPVEQNIPVRLITAENVDEVPEGSFWDGDIDYRSFYRDIWLP